MAYTEEQLESFKEPLSTTEEQRAGNALSMMQDAINDYDWSAAGITKPTVIKKGSYWHNTNVKKDSDVDVAVVFDYYTLPINTQTQSEDHLYSSGGNMSRSTLRDNLFMALCKKFGNGINIGKVAFQIDSNTYRLPIDVVCAVSAKDYITGQAIPGIVVLNKSGRVLLNYPDEEMSKGNNKNINTNYYYKKIVRILKKINQEQNFGAKSFMVESLVYNIPDNILTSDSTYRQKTWNVAETILSYLPFASGQFTEVNGIKPLFGTFQKWDVNDAHNFLTSVKAVL